MSSDNENFGEKLRRLRKEAKVSLNSLAKMIGISNTYLSEVELGKSDPLSPDRIGQVADALGLTAAQHLELRAHEAVARGRVAIESRGCSENEKIGHAASVIANIEGWDRKALEFTRLSLGLVSSVTVFSVEDTVGDAVEQLEAAVQQGTDFETLRDVVKKVATNLRQTVLTQHDSGPPDDDEINRLRSLEE